MRRTLIAFMAIALVSGPALAQTAGAPLDIRPAAQRAKPHHKVPTPRARPAGAGMDAFAAVTPAPADGKLAATAVQQNPLQLLQKFSVDDLNAALADAQGQTPPDTTAINCYTALIPIVQSNVANPLPAGPGVFQLAQKVRDFKALTANLQSPTGPLATLNQACAAWVLDGVNTFIGLGTQVGLIAATGGMTSVLPFSLPFSLPFH